MTTQKRPFLIGGIIMTAFGRHTAIKGILSILAAALILTLTACHQAAPPELQASMTTWQVLESQGDVRIETDDLLPKRTLRAGDQLQGDNRVAISRSAFFIAEENGLQVTARGGSAVILSSDRSSATLRPRLGTFRIRLAAAADDTKRVATPHLTASGTHAVVKLQVSDRETEIKVESGNIDIATSNGERYARLVEGGTARLGENTRAQLDIDAATKPASPPREAPKAGKGGDLDHRQAARAPLPIVDPPSKPTPELGEPGEMTIRLASKLKSETAKPEKKSSPVEIRHAEARQPIEAASMVRPVIPKEADLTERRPVRDEFDRLTEGLLEHLPLATKAPD